MKKFTKGLLTLTVLATMSLMAAEDSTIYVTTFEDEDGENPSKCSLREAVTAAALHQAYGGCPKGDQHNTNAKTIQLEEGRYILKRELTPNSPLYIIGREPADYSRANVINNDYPAKTPLKTIISGQGSSRLFNTIQQNKPGLTLENLILADGYSSDAGGALLLGGTTDLINVVIENSKSNKGGAIFLNDINSHLTVTNSVIQNNKANIGSALAMTCVDGLNYTQRNIGFNRTSIIANGDANSQSTLAFCGQPVTTISSSTISKNITNSTNGRIIEFSGATGSTNNSLSSNASIGLLSNTLVENTASTVLLYDLVGKKILDYNVLSFNTGKSCKFNGADVLTADNANIDTEKNAFNLTQNECELPQKVLDYAKTNTMNTDGLQLRQLLSPLQTDKEYTDFLPMYFPVQKTGVSLIDAGGDGGCAAYDQRGVKRIIETGATQSDSPNTCDIGSVEALRLTLQNIPDTNKSMTKLIESYQENYDLFNDLINNAETKPELLTYYRLRRDEFSNLIKFTKSDQKYRTIFVDPFASNLADENILADDARQIQHLNAKDYDVTVVSKGVGKLGSDGLFVGQADSRLKCTWNSNLNRIMLYREDDRLTAESDFEVCEYTVTNKKTQKSDRAFVLGRFTNIEPNVPEKLSFKIQHGGTQAVTVDLLKDANDDGDGLTSALANPNKSPFFLNQGQTQAIRIIKKPDAVSVRAERSGPCPNLDSKYTCYGGDVTFQLNNSLDVFSYDVQYVVYDLDGAPSAEGVVELVNSATEPGSVRSSGGGSTGMFTLLGLVGLLGYRLRRKACLKS